jgi:hypothetical protein
MASELVGVLALDGIMGAAHSVKRFKKDILSFASGPYASDTGSSSESLSSLLLESATTQSVPEKWTALALVLDPYLLWPIVPL